MKKLLLIAPAILAPCFSYGAAIGLSCSNTRDGTLSPNTTCVNYAGSVYYKCSNTISYSCNNVAGLKVTYNSLGTGAGTANDPKILTNCTKVECACDMGSYLQADKKTCAACSDNLQAIPDDSGADKFHTNMSCDCCPKTRFLLDREVYTNVYVKACETCPDNAICDGTKVFKCSQGYYLASSSSLSCTQCPEWSDVYDRPTNIVGATLVHGTTNIIGATSVTSCYIPTERTYYDNTGTFKLTSDCPYK